MISHKYASLALSLLIGATNALDLDANSVDSIKSTAKTLAGAIISAYNGQGEGFVPGLFSESGDPYYFWEAGTVWNGLVEYSHLTGDSQYNDIISNALWWQVSDTLNFMPPNQTKVLGNDDQSGWALAAMAAAEVGFPKPKEGEWVDLAKNVFDNQVLRWDNESCSGGLRWQIFTFNNGYNYKNSFANGNFFLLSARLAQHTNNKTYSDWANTAFQWARNAGLVSEEYAVFDGARVDQDCSSIIQAQWSSNHGVFTEGAAIMYNMTKNDEWKAAVQGFVNSSSVFLNNGVLTEVACETTDECDIDQRPYKGITARSYARAAAVAPIVAEPLRKILQASAKGAAEHCSGSGNELKCGFKWTEKGGDAAGVADNGLGEAFSAMEVVQGLLYSEEQRLSSGNGTSSQGTTTSSPSASGTAAPLAATGAAGKIDLGLGGVAAAALLAALSF